MEDVLILGIGGMLLFAIGIIVFVLFHQRRVIRYQLNLQELREEQQKQLLQAAIESEEKERKRIAGDLHDEIGGSLSTVRLYLLQASKKNSPEEIALTASNANKLLDDIIQKIRQLSHQLSPETLLDFGLQEALANLCRKISASGALAMSCHNDVPIPRFQPARELATYRIVQELTNNILKHAEASEISLKLSPLSQKIQIILEDNGKGFGQKEFEEMKHSPSGLGLKNIQSRIHILNASIIFTKKKSGKGTVIVIEVPIEPDNNGRS
jgi:signal transduction histidine kinase